MDVELIRVEYVNMSQRGGVMVDGGDSDSNGGGEVDTLQHSLLGRHFDCTTNVTQDINGMTGVPSGMMCVSVDGGSADTSSETSNVIKHIPGSGLTHAVKHISSSCYTLGQFNRKRTLGRDAQNLLDYFRKMQAENPGFYYAIQLDDDNRMANAFWADSRSRTAYNYFGDSVILDTKYLKNQYSVPFVPFTGVNHHGQIILFGCALLLDESEATYLWLFKTFLAAMNDRAPISLTTDKVQPIQVAVSQVFPNVCHRVDQWHMLREGQERMAHVCRLHPKLQLDLYNCINTTDSVEEFESFWLSILTKYDLKKNDWLQSIYDSRKQWVPAYFRDSFFAATFPGLVYDASFFDGYVNQQTDLPMFFRQYERAFENSFQREVEADFDTMYATPVLKTPSPMEKQAANLYTKRIFSKFQEELVETFVYTANRIDGDEHNNSIFRVAKFEDDDKAYFVSLSISEMKANCSCKMFEYSGILCRHVLTVFTVTNVLTLPSHYILKRWTRSAKTVDEFNELGGHESLVMRYNYLCKEAVRFAEEGAITPETYNATLIGLREGGLKVDSVKRSLSKVPPSSSQVSGVGYDDRRTSVENPEMTTLLWPQQDDIVRRFNLNDSGIPSQPISSPNAQHAPQVVLPCLKSMTWVMENKHLSPADRVAVINLKLQDYSKTPVLESEVKFTLSRITLEPMLRSMTYINDQLSAPANKVAVINLKLQDAETTSGESEVKFQVSKDTLGALLRSMAYIREQLNTVDPKQDNPAKRQRK